MASVSTCANSAALLRRLSSRQLSASRGKVVQVDRLDIRHQLHDPASKALSFNCLKAHPFPAIGFKYHLAPLHRGARQIRCSAPLRRVRSSRCAV